MYKKACIQKQNKNLNNKTFLVTKNRLVSSSSGDMLSPRLTPHPAIKLPKTGGGLYIWDWMKFDDHLIRDFNFQEEKEKSDWVSNQFIEHSKENIKNNPNLWENDSASFYQPDGNPKVEMYHEGSMIWFTGHVLHQIIPGYKLNPDDMRITLQGHGIKCDGTWRIYF